MRVFVTGATGFIGEALVRELLSSGYQVLGLSRSDVGAATLRKMGAEVHRGDLEHPDTLASGARGRRRDPRGLQPRLFEIRRER